MTIPTIGLTLDSEEPGGYSNQPWYAVRQNYCSSVDRAGGLPVLLPHTSARVSAYLDSIDGLIVTGGHFDVDPVLFGGKDRHDTVTLKATRTDFELAITRAALERDLPVLGICGGQQLLHVVLGGTLIQHIPDEIEEPLAHEQPNPRTEPGHTVRIVQHTLLHSIVKMDELGVNSAHHQAAKSPPTGIIVNATAPDGVIEGIESPDYRFCLGVQWHPEYEISSGDSEIFQAFVGACRG